MTGSERHLKMQSIVICLRQLPYSVVIASRRKNRFPRVYSEGPQFTLGVALYHTLRLVLTADRHLKHLTILCADQQLVAMPTDAPHAQACTQPCDQLNIQHGGRENLSLFDGMYMN